MAFGALLVVQNVAHMVRDETIVGRVVVFPDQTIVITQIGVLDYLRGHRTETHVDIIQMPFGSSLSMHP